VVPSRAGWEPFQCLAQPLDPLVDLTSVGAQLIPPAVHFSLVCFGLGFNSAVFIDQVFDYLMALFKPQVGSHRFPTTEFH